MSYQKIFIVGSPRSGTHWLRRLMSTHPEIVSNDFESNIYKIIIGSLLYSRLPWNRSWKTVLKNFDNSHLSNWVERDEFLTQIKLVKSDTSLNNNFQRGLKLIQIIFDNYYYRNKTVESSALLEKTPDHLTYTDIILDQFPEARIIHIVRDGRDVLLSLNKLKEKGEGWVPNKRSGRIDLWKNAIRQGLGFRENNLYKDRITTIKYEDLMDSPEKTISQLFNFLGLKNRKFLIQNASKEYFPKSKNYGKWESELSENDLKAFKKRAQSLLHELGYN
ncbi:MAG: sulfotransferase [Nitrososphaeraceae archaeon]|nr:sulfotransferase [Nitrososphaeraceae archaeon]